MIGVLFGAIGRMFEFLFWVLVLTFILYAFAVALDGDKEREPRSLATWGDLFEILSTGSASGGDGMKTRM
jgi:hypothetical protein